MIIAADEVRALKEKVRDQTVLLLPENNCFNCMGPNIETTGALINKRILLSAGQGRTRIFVGVPCANNRTDAWSYDTARILCRWYQDSGYYARVDPRIEQYGSKRYFLVTIDWREE